MSFAPPTILAVRKLIQQHVPQLSAVELGIVGDDSHANSGTSYHLGKDAVKSTAYSVVESSRDKSGLSDAASALDIGYFKITVKGKAFTLRDMNAWIVGQCAANAADTRDIREIIYTLDGQVVKRWDDLKIRSTGDSSHLTHTHVSWYRDSEKRDKTSIFRRWFEHIGAIEKEDDMALTSADGITVWKTDIIPNPAFRPDSAGNPTTTAFFAIGDVWRRVGGIESTLADMTSRLSAIESTLARLAAATPAPGIPPITTEQVIEALREVLRDGIGE